MKTYLFSLGLAFLTSIIFIYPVFAKNYASLLIFNSENIPRLPSMFRVTHFLNASGSAQFSKAGLEKILGVIPNDNIVLIDLREEPHGFIDGRAISWYVNRNWFNVGKDTEEIIKGEIKLLNKLANKPLAFVFKHRKFPVPHFKKEIISEESLTSKFQLGYLRLPVTDHRRPSDDRVDCFIQFVKNLRENTWLHFHCSAGKGRTTTFLALYDMILHAKRDTLDDIITRQEFFGGINLFSLPPQDDWKLPFIKERVKFLKDFYEYCRETHDYQISWSEWLQEKSQQKMATLRHSPQNPEKKFTQS